MAQVENSLAANNSNAGGGFYSQGGQFYYVRGLGLVKSLAVEVATTGVLSVMPKI